LILEGKRMRDEELRRLIRLVEESQIDELEVRRFFTKVRITKAGALARSGVSARPSQPEVALAPPTPREEAEQVPAPVEARSPADEGLVPIVSPIVGTFYSSPSPESAPYVEVGTRVAPGQVVCIIEAMKLMNEIESESSGTIEKILVEDAQPVEFNQALFLIRPDAAQERRQAS
jgi:acetyl-CoA carboxylase biotin carboxyl carrier protein